MDIHSYLETLATIDTKFNFEKKEGLGLRKIIEIENRLKIKLPNDLINFYSYSNGLDGNDWIFNIIPLYEVEKLKDAEGEYLTFAEYMIYSETCGLQIDPLERNRYRFFTHKNDKDKNIFKRKYLCNSFSDFIKLYCDQGTFGVFAD
jgi:hypothetical protein